jgi:hypothetical protein
MLVPETEPSEFMKIAPADCALTPETNAVKLIKHTKTHTKIIFLFMFIMTSSLYKAQSSKRSNSSPRGTRCSYRRTGCQKHETIFNSYRNSSTNPPLPLILLANYQNKINPTFSQCCTLKKWQQPPLPGARTIKRTVY